LESLLKAISLDYYDCDKNLLKDICFIEKAMLEAAEVMGASVKTYSFHEFEPFGVSGAVIIAESHLAIHTFPEYSFAAVTIETCGTKINSWDAHFFLKEKFKAKSSNHSESRRGLFDAPRGSMPHKPV
jgi:S-adenosylmethionine decarboxylase